MSQIDISLDNQALSIAMRAGSDMYHEMAEDVYALRVALALVKAERDEARDEAASWNDAYDSAMGYVQQHRLRAERAEGEVEALKKSQELRIPKYLPTITPEALAEIVDHIRNGGKIAAIKAVREAVAVKEGDEGHTKSIATWGLKEAKDFVEALADHLGYDGMCRPKQPEPATNHDGTAVLGPEHIGLADTA